MIKIPADFGPIELDYDPSRYTSTASAARAMAKALRKLCTEMDMEPREVILCTPSESDYLGTGLNWRVIWKCGPFEWAVGASFEVENSPHWYTESYYSYDLCFTY